jgi:hypothetical protein
VAEGDSWQEGVSFLNREADEDLREC